MAKGKGGKHVKASSGGKVKKTVEKYGEMKGMKGMMTHGSKKC